MILIDNLTRKFGKLLAVDSLNLRVESAQILAFLGKNGAGKTTTIKMMTGLLAPSDGTVFMCGEQVTASNHKAHRLYGYIPDQPELFSKLTALDCLKQAAELHDTKLSKIEAMRFLEEAGLAEKQAHLVKTFSRGMGQRLSIAMARVHNPEIYILDEPLVGLDPIGIVNLKELLKSLAKGGKTIFLSTHNLTFAEDIADTIAVIREGKLRAFGTPKSIRENSGVSATLHQAFTELTSSNELEED